MRARRGRCDVSGRCAAAGRLALLGTGTVGRAVSRALGTGTRATLGDRGCTLVYVANSRLRRASAMALRRRRAARRAARRGAPTRARRRSSARRRAHRHRCDGQRRLAARHPRWLARGHARRQREQARRGHALARWHAIRDAVRATAASYGDGATVGAGLPLLRIAPRAARRRRPHPRDRRRALGFAGLAVRPFRRHAAVFGAGARGARAGYTEPDPRDDLSGEDVRRKLLILARSRRLRDSKPNQVEVDSLVPPAWRSCRGRCSTLGLPRLDAPLRARLPLRGRAARCALSRARRPARVGLEALRRRSAGRRRRRDNRVAIWSGRYRDRRW